MKLVILITAQVENGLNVAQLWQEIGAPGITIIRTHGIYSLQEKVKKGDVELPRLVVSMANALAHVLDRVEETGEMIISVVEDNIIDNMIEAANNVLGDLTEPNTGVLFVIDIERAIGVYDHGQSAGQSAKKDS